MSRVQRYVRPKNTVRANTIRIAPDGKSYFIKRVIPAKGECSIIPAHYSGAHKKTEYSAPLINAKRRPISEVSKWRSWSESAA